MAYLRLFLWLGVLHSGVAGALPAQDRQLEGVLHTAIADGLSGQATLLVVLRDDAGLERRLLLPPAEFARLGGVRGAHGARVALTGRPVAGDPSTLQVATIRALLTTPAQPASAAPLAEAWIVLGCKFAGTTEEPTTPGFRAGLAGATYPGLIHYWSEVSHGSYDIAGTTSAPWFTLPQSFAFYHPGGSADGGLLRQDCLAAADPTIDFSPYAGVVFQHNAVLTMGGSAIGGFAYLAPVPVTVDGAMRNMRVAFISGGLSAQSHAVYAHEMGHTLGMMHTGVSAANPYASHWDVMSFGYRWETAFGDDIAVGPHPIAGHKYDQEWLAPARVFSAPMGVSEVALERSANPVDPSRHLVALVPRAGSDEYYTVEVRMPAGYDKSGSPNGLPGSGVVIHRRDPTPASVFDAVTMDGDGNGIVNDAGAIWTPGEIFTDAAGQVAIRVDEALGATGFLVTITRGSLPTCSVSVSASPPQGGTATVTAGGTSGACGRQVTVAATAAAGWTFLNWTEGGNVVSSQASFSFALATTRALVANFQQQCTVTTATAPAGGGGAAVTAGGAVGACGRQVTVTATASPGWRFLHWSEGGTTVSTEASYAFTVTVSRNLLATFLRQCAVSLSPAPAGGGTTIVTGGGATGDCGREVTVTATPAAAHLFVDWTENGTSVSTQASYTFVIAGDRTLVGNFQRQCALLLEAVPPAGGTVAIMAGGATGPCGRSVTVTATAAEKFRFLEWTENGQAVFEEAEWSFTLATDRSLKGHFQPQCAITLRAAPTPGGAAAVTAGESSGPCGRTVTLAATPSTHWGFLGWYEGETRVETANPWSFALAADRQVDARFEDFAARAQLLIEPLVQHLLGGPAVSAPDQVFLDAQGNANGRLDLGDLLAVLDRFAIQFGPQLSRRLEGLGVSIRRIR